MSFSTRLGTATSAIILLPLLAPLACGHPEAGGDSSEGMKLPVAVMTVREETIRDASQYLAKLVSRHQVALYPQVVGNVSAILVKPGDKVKSGAALLQIDPRRESANLTNQVAARAQKEASLDLAKKTEGRSLLLLKDGLMSRQEYDQNKSQSEVAAQELRAQEAAIAAQESQLAYYRILAPFDGTVGDIPVKLGDFVTAQTKLTSLDENSNLEAYVNIPADKLKLLGPSSTIEILDGETAITEAKISFVADEANPETQSVLIKAIFPNDKALRAAQVVHARVVWGSHPGFRVPTSAVLRQSGQFFVFTAQADAKAGAVAKQSPLTLGDVDDNHYAVLAGLKAGDRVITSQLQKLRDGAPVDPQEPPAAAAEKR